MKRILLALALSFAASSFAVEACEIQRDKHGRIARSKKVLAEFRKTHPCPGTGLISKSCKGWTIDHVIPLACEGCDAVENLQWQNIADAKAKDRWERKVCGVD